jgi:hypothetical protein
LRQNAAKNRKFKDFGRRVEMAFSHAGSRVEAAGERLHQRIRDEGWDHEAERLIDYVNDEVVPAIRSHSSQALKAAAKKLSDFADLLEEHRE